MTQSSRTKSKQEKKVMMRQKRAKQNRKIPTLVFSANEKMGHKNEYNPLAFDFPVKSLF